MSELGDLFETAYEAPHALTVHARGHGWTNPEGMSRAMKEWAGGRAGTAVIAFAGGGDVAPSPDGERFELWWQAGGRLRSERQGGIEVRADGRLTTFHPVAGAIDQPEDRAPHQAAPLALSARAMLEGLEFRVVESTTWLDRPAWVIEGHPGSGRSWGPPPPWTFELPGRDYSFLVDKITGLVLRAEGRLDGEEISWMRMDELDVDGPIDEGVFQLTPPDGTPVRSPEQALLEHLAQQGVDVSAIDAHDPEQVHAAVQAHHESVFGRRRPLTIEELAENIPVLGRAPSDEAAALTDVRDAFRRMAELSADGLDLAVVERGAGLGDCLRAARERAGRGGDAVFEVLHVKFVSDVEAVVWYVVTVNGTRVSPLQMEGRAVRVDDRWLVTRATFCQLMQLAGVVCPPPATS